MNVKEQVAQRNAESLFALSQYKSIEKIYNSYKENELDYFLKQVYTYL